MLPMTIVQTAKKLGVNCYKYFYDRISGALKMMSLADIILLNTHRRLLIRYFFLIATFLINLICSSVPVSLRASHEDKPLLFFC